MKNAILKKKSRMYKFARFVAACAAVLCAFGASAKTLPAGYQAVEYVDSTGTQWFDTGIVVNENHEFRFKYAMLSISAYKGPFGSYASENHNATRVMASNGSTTALLVNFMTKASGGGTTFNNVTTKAGDVVEGWMNYNRAKFNAVEQDLKHVTFGTADNSTLKLLGRSGYATSIRLYYFDVYEANELKHSYIPCYEVAKPTNIRIYDTCTSAFLPMSGSGALKKGGDISLGGELCITGTPDELGAVLPAYGVKRSIAPGESFTCSAPAVWTNAEGTVAATCTGYKVYTNDAVCVEGGENSFTYKHPDSETGATLVWQWRCEYKVTVGCTDGGSVMPAGNNWVVRGGSLTTVATAVGSGIFKGWVDSLSARTLTTDPTLELKNITEPQAVDAQFATALHITNDPAVGDYAAAFAEALELAKPGDVITLDEGVYPISQSVVLSTGITVKGAGMDKTVVTATGPNYRAFYLQNKDAVVEDLTVRGFKANSVREHYGTGFRVDSGCVKNCRATENSSGNYYNHGVGFYLAGANSSATNCLSDHNVGSTSTSGTGFYLKDGAKIWNCLAYDNTVCGQTVMSAAIHVVNSGTVYSSTVVGTVNDGGIYLENGGVATNCVSAGNSNYGAHLLGLDAPDIGVSKTSLQGSVRCCVTGHLVEFRDAANGDYRLRPALAALTNAGYSPYDPTEDALDFVADDTHAFVDEEITLTAVQNGKYEGLGLSWKVEDASGATYPVYGSNPATVALPAQGRYTVTLTAAGETPCVRTDYLYVRNLTNELAVTGVADELPAAVDAMIDGETLILGEGTYPTTRPVYMTNNVTIVGKGWDRTTVSKTGSRGVFIMAAENAHLTGCTVTGGKANDYYNITGSGVRITGRGGKLSWCRMTGNLHGAYYTDGLGVGMESVNAWVTHCMIDNNTGSLTFDCGGGVNMKNGLLENCLIVNNTAQHGGGVYVGNGSGKIRHCTVAKNTAGANGGGICGKQPYGNYVFTDCVIAENTADSDKGSAGGKPNWSTTDSIPFNASSFVNCAIGNKSAIRGDTSFNVNAPFVDLEKNDFHLDKSGDAVDGGGWYEDMADVDLDGFDRVSGEAPDCGCYEVDMSVTDCSFEVSPLTGFVGVPLICTPTVINPPVGVTFGYRWTFRDSNGVETVFTGESPSVSIAQGGVYTVKLEVYDVEKPETVLATNTRANFVRLACQKVFAVGGGVNPTMAEPFDTWEKAQTNLNELETYLIGGCEVELGEGEFIVTNHLVLAQEIQYHGKGIDKTVVRCSNCRAFYLNHEKALVENLTVTNGNCRPFVAASNGYSEPGLGICIALNGGTVRDCRVTGSKCSAFYQQGAIACMSSKGCVSRCIIDHNTATTGDNSYAGLYLSHGCADDCLVYSNKSTSAAGLAIYGNDDALVSNCTFTANTATAKSSGGIRYIFASPSPHHDIVNCIFSGNKGCARETTSAGGQYDVNELDFNWNPAHNLSDAQIAADKIKGVLKNCCFQLTDPEATLGTNSLNADPKFVDADACDYRLVETPRAERSPCVDAGLCAPWMKAATDLDGKARVKHVLPSGKARVDIGCYESAYWPIGLMLMVQ